MKTGIYWQNPAYPAKGMDFIFDPSLVLYLPLHKLDGASFMSRDAYGHLCTVTGALWTPRGRRFDGSDDDIEIAHHSALVPDEFTIEVWERLDGYTGIWEALLDKREGGTFTGYILQHNPTQSYKVRFHNAAAGNLMLSDAWIPILGAWYCYGITYNGTTYQFYVNGQADNACDAGSPGSTTVPFRLGRGNYADEWLDGAIGEVRLYNRALTPQEIRRNYLATKWRCQ